MSRPLRVGAVSYLNTKPLIRHLPELMPEMDLRLEVPSKLATDLAAGRLDVALIPSIEYFRGKGYTLVPGASISSFGPVMSVKLCSRVPFGDIKHLCLDEGSRTSIALMTVLLYHLFGVSPTNEPLPMDADPMSAKGDGVLVIGDRAMKIRDGSFPFTLDLGYEWSRWTGLPFVWAGWAVAPGVELTPDEIIAFERAKELGIPEIPAIADEESNRLGLDKTQCRYYLERVIRHGLMGPEKKALECFYQLAVERGLAPRGVKCVFHGSGHFAESC